MRLRQVPGHQGHFQDHPDQLQRRHEGDLGVCGGGGEADCILNCILNILNIAFSEKKTQGSIRMNIDTTP